MKIAVEIIFNTGNKRISKILHRRWLNTGFAGHCCCTDVFHCPALFVQVSFLGLSDPSDVTQHKMASLIVKPPIDSVS